MSKDYRNIRKAKRIMERRNINKGLIDYLIKKYKATIPNLRIADYKFMPGVVRIHTKCDIFGGDGLSYELNKVLKSIEIGGHIDEYDSDFNGLSAMELSERFSGTNVMADENDRREVCSRTYTENTDYKIIPIDTFEDASKFSKHTDWCITRSKTAFNNYLDGGSARFYFCIKNGFESIQRNTKEIGNPLDEYGLSMIAVSVNEDGSCNTITCRWNHNNGDDDHVMTPLQLSQLIGRNFYETFKPWTKEELEKNGALTISIANRMIAEDVDNVNVLFDKCVHISDGYAIVISTKFNKTNILDKYEKRLLLDKWPIYIRDIPEGKYVIIKNIFHKDNIFRYDGKFMLNEWADYVKAADDNRHAIIERMVDGDATDWYDKNVIDMDGNYVFDKWSNNLTQYLDGVAVMCIDNKYYLMTKEGKYINDVPFDSIHSFKDGYALVARDDKWNYVNAHGEFLLDRWVFNGNSFNCRHAAVQYDKDGKWFLIDNSGRKVVPRGYDRIEIFFRGYATVVLNGMYNYIDVNGRIMSDIWFEDVNNFMSNGQIMVKTEGTWYYINHEFKIIGEPVMATA